MIKSQKIKLLLIASLIIIVMLLIITTITRNQKQTPKDSYISDPTNPSIIKQQSLQTDNNGNYLLIQKEAYHVNYQQQYNTYLISILKSPFETFRQQAETDLINLFKVPPATICQLKIQITTPRFANPELAGKIFKPSFCQ